jgi:hypothetical protein
MASRRRQEGGKKQNAEGMHGDRTHEAILEQLKHGLPDPPAPVDEAAAADGDLGGNPNLKAHAPGPDGKHRLFEHRQQHDEADRNSEKNRLAREARGLSPGRK